MNNFFITTVITLFFLFYSPLLSKTIIINENFKSLVIGKYLEYYEDKENKLTIEEVSKSNFQNNFIESKIDSLNFGYTKSTYWIKIEIQPELLEKKKYLLEYSYPMIGSIQFYFLSSDNTWKVKQTGSTFPFKQRDLKNRNFLFQFLLIPEQKQVYYLKLNTSGTMQIPLKIYDKDSYIEFINEERFLLGVYYGIVMVMVVYNMLLYFSMKDILHIYYVLYLISFSFFVLGINGISFEYLWNEKSYLNYLIPFFMFSGLFFLILFSLKFLDSKKNLHKITSFFNFSLAAIILLAIYSLNIHSYDIMLRIATISGMLLVALLLLISFYIYFQGYRPARFYILAFTITIVGTIIYALRSLGIIPSNFFTEYTMQIGSALESVLLSLAVADKIAFIRKEKERVKNQLIQNQQESIENQKRLIKSYARFIPEELLLFLGKGMITEINLGDSVQKNMTVLFSDIRSFTTLSESMSPEESFSFINSYLNVIAPCIRKYNGYIDKFIGDGIMALFPNKPQDAIEASIEMLEALHKLNLKRKEKGYANISIGIGIHTGNQILGVIGEQERLEGTVISDVVNTASRLEGLTKAYSCSLIVSEDVLSKLENKEKYFYRLLDTVKVKGKNKAIKILEILNGLSPRLIQLKLQTKESFEKGIQLYTEMNFKGASDLFQQVLKIDPKDKAAELYTKRCDFYLKFGVSPDWNGIEALDFK